jgi:hypothetical protein
MKSSISAAFLLAAMATLPTLAMAADSADRHLNRGVQLLSRDKNKEALEEFRTANALSPSPEAIVQIGLAESALKLWMNAEKHIVEGLGADTDNWVKHNRQPIEEQLAEVRSHLGWLIVTGTPGTEVSIDGIPVGKLPLPSRTRRAEGSAVVQGRLPGHPAIVKNVEVLGKGNQAVRLEFAVAAPLPPAPTVSAPAPAPQTSAAPSPARASSNAFFYQSLPWLSTAAGALTLGDLALILQTNHSCTGTSSCGPSKALEASVGITGIAGLTMGGVALLMGVTHRSDPQLVKPVLLASSALAAVGAIAGGVTLVRDNQHSGSDGKWAYGAGTIGAGSIVLLLDTFAIFERTPERVRPIRVALVPTPGGLNLLGTF